MTDHEFYDVPPKDKVELLGIYKGANKILWQLIGFYEEDIDLKEKTIRELQLKIEELRRLKAIPNGE